VHIQVLPGGGRGKGNRAITIYDCSK